YARMKRVLLKPPEDVEVSASSSQPPGDGGPGSGGVKEVPQLVITKTASGRQVAESSDKKEDPGDKSDKPDQQEPPEQQSGSKSAEKPPPTPPPCEIVSKSPSVSGESEETGQSDAEMASTEVQSAKSRSARSTESEASQPVARDPSPFRTAPCVDSPSISEGVLETSVTDDRLSEIIGAFSSMQENLEEAFANGQAMRLVALTDQNLATDHMYHFQKSDLAAFPLTQHSYWLPPSVAGTVQEIQEENANFWSEVQNLIISTMTNVDSEWYQGFRKAEDDMGILLAIAALMGKSCQAKGGIQVVLTLDERRRVWGAIDPRNESAFVTQMFHAGLHMPACEMEHDDNLAAQLSDQMEVIMKGVKRISLPEDSTVEQSQETS
ncbi:MAG: hypothetical protein GY820_25885, partial [Gammaproteobacteria bacterium]|nr:hypothetical protein [Gammaproteobacteria bacterium]